MWDLKVTSKEACVGVNPRREESMDSELAHGHVSKLLLEVVIDLGLNLIVKTLILFYWI